MTLGQTLALSRTRLFAGAISSLTVLACIALIGPNQAASHSAGTFYDEWWQSDLTVHWRFESGFPTGSGMRARVEGGAASWTALSPVMNFTRDTPDYSNFAYTSCPSTYQKNGVHWENIDGHDDTLASVRHCQIGDTELFTIQMRFDSSEDWYSQPDTPGSDQYDLWSVATHEFGHATGWRGHFGSSSTECSGSPEQTMCPKIDETEKHWRTLESHDIHTFTNKYP